MGLAVMRLAHMGLARPRHPDVKLLRLASQPAFGGLRRPALVTLGAILDELAFPAGSMLVQQGRLATEALLLLQPGDRVLDGHGIWTVPSRGLTIGLVPWLGRGCHPDTVIAASDVTAYVVPGPAVRLLLETAPPPQWRALELPPCTAGCVTP
jgi:hypothetical protein